MVFTVMRYQQICDLVRVMGTGASYQQSLQQYTPRSSFLFPVFGLSALPFHDIHDTLGPGFSQLFSRDPKLGLSREPATPGSETNTESRSDPIKNV